jgi:MurNAc alpha-1-phosphate uridylyltransferase
MLTGPVRAMVLAAGHGTRMRPLTMHTPKPLLTVNGRSLLDRALDRLAAAGVAQVAVNGHWLAPKIEAAARARRHPRCIYLHEERLLDTGGGIVNALRAGAVGPGPFFTVNGDSLWLDGPTPALHRLTRAFEPRAMDVMLLLVASPQVNGYQGRGDFVLEADGRLAWPQEGKVAPFVFIGVQIMHPRLFEKFAGGAFGMHPVWAEAIDAGRAFGLRHDGGWFHLSTPADLAHAETTIAAGSFAETR